MEAYTYLLVLAFSAAVPLIRSFEKTHIHFISKMRYLLPATLVMCAIFVSWDVLFTHWGVWGFSDVYTIDLFIFGLPIEEWLFFLVIPYVCLFSYEVLNYFIKKDLLGSAAIWISAALMVLFTFLLIKYTDTLYTSWVMVFDIVLLSLVAFAWRPQWLGRFYVMFIIIAIPFALVNGTLTGSFFDRIIVWYNPEAIMGFRVLTIPIEDFFYSFGMLLTTTAVYEKLREKKEGLSNSSKAAKPLRN